METHIAKKYVTPAKPEAPANSMALASEFKQESGRMPNATRENLITSALKQTPSSEDEATTSSNGVTQKKGDFHEMEKDEKTEGLKVDKDGSAKTIDVVQNATQPSDPIAIPNSDGSTISRCLIS